MKFREDIQGLRALAVLSVVIYHISPHHLPGGFIGVDIFFVISGYLIMGQIYDKVQNSTKELLERRENLLARFLEWALQESK